MTTLSNMADNKPENKRVKKDLYAAVQELEVSMILEALSLYKTTARAAEMLKINRTTLVEKMKKLGILNEVKKRKLLVEAENQVYFKGKPVQGVLE